jgi:hypothetical protein
LRAIHADSAACHGLARLLDAEPASAHHDGQRIAALDDFGSGFGSSGTGRAINRHEDAPAVRAGAFHPHRAARCTMPANRQRRGAGGQSQAAISRHARPARLADPGSGKGRHRLINLCRIGPSADRMRAGLGAGRGMGQCRQQQRQRGKAPALGPEKSCRVHGWLLVMGKSVSLSKQGPCQACLTTAAGPGPDGRAKG